VAAHAGDGAADEEAVHDYRVALRRLRSALRALRPAWGKGAMVPLEAELKVLADATGDVRDEEVLAETLERIELPEPARDELARWGQGRARRLAGARAAAARKLAGAELGHRLGEALGRIERAFAAPMRRPLGVEALRRRAIGRMLHDLTKRARGADPDDVAGMHAVRIRIKRLRYATELLVADDAPAEAALDLAKKLQKRLGELHDLDEALSRMGRAMGLRPGTRAAVAEGLRALREQTARKAERDLGACLPRLERAIEALLEPTG
jgi:CHAD domain-containing protein